MWHSYHYCATNMQKWMARPLGSLLTALLRSPTQQHYTQRTCKKQKERLMWTTRTSDRPSVRP